MKLNLVTQSSRNLRLAVITFGGGDLVLRVCNGILHVLEECDGWNCASARISEEYCSKNLGLNVREVLARYEFDAILSVGRAASHAAQEATKYQGVSTPIIFGGVIDPVGERLIASRYNSGNNLTGIVATSRDYTSQVARFLQLGYRVERFLIIRESGDYEEEATQLDRAAEYLRMKGVSVETLVFSGYKDLGTLLNQLKQKPNVIMLSHDTFIVSLAPQIVEYCNDNKVVLFASDPETVKLGAAIGYCDPSENIGAAIAQKALKVLLEKKNPQDIPTTTMEWKGKFVFNLTACKIQGLSCLVE